MPGWLTEMLAAHLRQRGLSGADTDAFVFVWRGGGVAGWRAPHHSSWRKHWLIVVSAAGLPNGFGFHDLRRANATGLVAGGVDVRTAQARLGHSDVRLTLEIYAKATSEADRAAAEAIGRLFDPRRTNRGISRDRRGIASGKAPSKRSRRRLTCGFRGRVGEI